MKFLPSQVSILILTVFGNSAAIATSRMLDYVEPHNPIVDGPEMFPDVKLEDVPIQIEYLSPEDLGEFQKEFDSNVEQDTEEDGSD